MPNLIVIVVLTAVIHCLETAAYASRIAGVRTGRLALTGSLFSMVSLVSRAANTLQAPLLAHAVDRLVLSNGVDRLPLGFHWIIAAASFGTVIGALLIPTFASLFSRGTMAYEARGSFPALIVHSLSARGLSRIGQHIRIPASASLATASRFNLPRSFFVLTVMVTAIYTVGVLSTMYASALTPNLVRTAATLSGVINGFGTLLLVFLVDPVSALITDQALRGSRPVSAVSSIVIWQTAGRLVGTVLAQFLFWPATLLVSLVARHL